jgi:phosphatidylglycerophosphate synthase
MVPVVRTRHTIPNVLTVARMAMAALAAVLAGAGAEALAVAILIAAALLDVFDGWYARAFAQPSALGAHLDPLADKILMGVVFGWIGLEAASGPVWVLIGLVALRELVVTLLRSFSLRRRGRFIPASRLGRLKMLTQSIVGLTLLGVMHFLDRPVPEAVVRAGLVAVLAASYASGAGYLARWRREESGRRGDGGRDAGDAPPERRVSAAR